MNEKKNPFKIGDRIIVARAISDRYNGVIAVVTGVKDDICRLKDENNKYNDLAFMAHKLDLYKEENEI